MKKYKKQQVKRKAFLSKCPFGGYCFNPLCALGCVQKSF